jgi:hypothetical protein
MVTEAEDQFPTAMPAVNSSKLYQLISSCPAAVHIRCMAVGCQIDYRREGYMKL